MKQKPNMFQINKKLDLLIFQFIFQLKYPQYWINFTNVPGMELS